MASVGSVKTLKPGITADLSRQNQNMNSVSSFLTPVLCCPLAWMLSQAWHFHVLFLKQIWLLSLSLVWGSYSMWPYQQLKNIATFLVAVEILKHRVWGRWRTMLPSLVFILSQKRESGPRQASVRDYFLGCTKI